EHGDEDRQTPEGPVVTDEEEEAAEQCPQPEPDQRGPGHAALVLRDDDRHECPVVPAAQQPGDVAPPGDDLLDRAHPVAAHRARGLLHHLLAHACSPSPWVSSVRGASGEGGGGGACRGAGGASPGGGGKAAVTSSCSSSTCSSSTCASSSPVELTSSSWAATLSSVTDWRIWSRRS